MKRLPGQCQSDGKALTAARRRWATAARRFSASVCWGLQCDIFDVLPRRYVRYTRIDVHGTHIVHGRYSLASLATRQHISDVHVLELAPIVEGCVETPQRCFHRTRLRDARAVPTFEYSALGDSMSKCDGCASHSPLPLLGVLTRRYVAYTPFTLAAFIGMHDRTLPDAFRHARVRRGLRAPLASPATCQPMPDVHAL